MHLSIRKIVKISFPNELIMNIMTLFIRSHNIPSFKSVVQELLLNLAIIGLHNQLQGQIQNL